MCIESVLKNTICII